MMYIYLYVVYAYCCKRRLKANVTNSAVMVFARDAVEGSWKWGQDSPPNVSKYTYLGGSTHVPNPA